MLHLCRQDVAAVCQVHILHSCVVRQLHNACHKDAAGVIEWCRRCSVSRYCRCYFHWISLLERDAHHLPLEGHSRSVIQHACSASTCSCRLRKAQLLCGGQAFTLPNSHFASVGCALCVLRHCVLVQRLRTQTDVLSAWKQE
jgi:hypothetical protein